jgi:transcriptional regulator GlxA family with amidase domain
MNVGFLVLDRVYNSELMAPYDIFQHTIFHTKPGMKVFTISPDGGKITTFEGLRLETDFSLVNSPDMDVLVIPSAEHNMDSDLKNQTVKEWIRKTSESADYVVTLCDGAFLLANTGLLDGKEATTFPSDLDAFRKMFPSVKAHEGLSFVHDGKYITSQGGAKSYDAALYLVALLYGDKVAAGVGRGLVLPWPDPTVKFHRAR